MPPLLDQPQLQERQKMTSKQTDDDAAIIHAEATVLEEICHAHLQKVEKAHGVVTAMNVGMNAGIYLIAEALSFFEDDTERLVATIHAFTTVTHQLKLTIVENAAESIIKKAMKK
jgi:hypothetical protein